MADVETLEAVQKRIDAVEVWQNATERLERADREKRAAECALHNAINALGRELIPKDANEGETYCVWIGDTLYAVRKRNKAKEGSGYAGTGDYVIDVRKPKR